MWNKVKTGAFEWLKTLSSSPGFLSSKRLERFAFIGLTLMLTLGCFIFLAVKGTLTSGDTVLLTTPLLIAAGFNMTQTEKAKNKNNEGINGEV
jgi:hypothetical protein